MIRVSAAVARMRRKGCTRRHHIARWLLLWESEFITATLQCWLNRWKGGQDTNWSPPSSRNSATATVADEFDRGNVAAVASW